MAIKHGAARMALKLISHGHKIGKAPRPTLEKVRQLYGRTPKPKIPPTSYKHP